MSKEFSRNVLEGLGVFFLMHVAFSWVAYDWWWYTRVIIEAMGDTVGFYRLIYLVFCIMILGLMEVGRGKK
jgi:hypothetical protein